MASAKHSSKTKSKGHTPTARDLVSIRNAKKIEDLVPAKRHARVSKLYGYKA